MIDEAFVKKGTAFIQAVHFETVLRNGVAYRLMDPILHDYLAVFTSGNGFLVSNPYEKSEENLFIATAKHVLGDLKQLAFLRVMFPGASAIELRDFSEMYWHPSLDVVVIAFKAPTDIKVSEHDLLIPRLNEVPSGNVELLCAGYPIGHTDVAFSVTSKVAGTHNDFLFLTNQVHGYDGGPVVVLSLPVATVSVISEDSNYIASDILVPNGGVIGMVCIAKETSAGVKTLGVIPMKHVLDCFDFPFDHEKGQAKLSNLSPPPPTLRTPRSALKAKVEFFPEIVENISGITEV